MFKFMQEVKKRDPNKMETPTTILKLNETENDMFIRLFSKEFVCVESALRQKHELSRTKRALEK